VKPKTWLVSIDLKSWLPPLPATNPHGPRTFDYMEVVAESERGAKDLARYTLLRKAAFEPATRQRLATYDLNARVDLEAGDAIVTKE